MAGSLRVNPNAPNLINICVDGREGSEFHGRLFSRLSSKEQPFGGVSSLMMTMHDFFDSINFPQASTEVRSFHKPRQEPAAKKDTAPLMTDNDITEQRGEMATFIVRVQYRQNATWQGSVLWAERNLGQEFRSALELLKLIDSALGESDE